MKRTTAPIPFASSQLDETRHVCAFFNRDDEEYRVLLPITLEEFLREFRQRGAHRSTSRAAA